MLSSSPLSLLRKAAIWKRIEPVWKQQAGEEDTEDLTLTLSHEMSIYTPIPVNLQYPSDHWADQEINLWTAFQNRSCSKHDKLSFCGTSL